MPTPKYRIVPKRDFGKYGFLINGEVVKTGFVVTDGRCNVMPGATWFQTIRDALVAIRCLEVSLGNSDLFWKLLRDYFKRGTDIAARERECS